MTNPAHRVAWALATCIAAPWAIAQDSVSPLGALPGDALSVYDAGEVCNAYVVDTVPLIGSWGTPLRIAPVLKAPRLPGVGVYNNLVSAQAISHDIRSGGFARTSYQHWAEPGAGINDAINTPPPDVIHPAGSSPRLAVAIADYGTSAEGSPTAVSTPPSSISPSSGNPACMSRASTRR